jgi:hypothetical protein
MEKFITIAVFDYIHEIQILKHRLDQENYNIFFENHVFFRTNVFECTGIKLKIHPNDFETVKTILQNEIR